MKRDPEQSGEVDTVALASRLLGIVNSSWMSQATRVAAELGVPDLLADGPKRSEEVAAAAGAHAPSLHRLLRALVTIDICRERDDGRFELTPLGGLLRTGVEGSVRSWTIYWGGEQWPVWGRLLESVRTGESGRKLMTGAEGFEHLERNPEAAALFNQAMVELTRLAGRSIVGAYDFSSLAQIVDVGGGYGELLAAILAAYPSTRGVLFDLPHAIDSATGHLQQAGVADRCQLVAGSFFETIPAGADAYVLKSVIHDWNDERGRVILENCRRAMGSGAKVLIIERIMPDRLEPSPEHQALARGDLNMLVALAAQERTEGEFRSLLISAGFEVARIVPCGVDFSVIEAVPTGS